MKKSFAVIGLGRFGLGLVEELAKSGADVIAVDTNPKAVESASKFVEQAVICDGSIGNNLLEIGVKNVDHAIVALSSNLVTTITITIILAEMGINKITVRIDDSFYTNTLLKLGATDVIFPERMAGIRLADKIFADSFVDYYNIEGDYCVVRILINENFKAIPLEELNARNNFDINIALIRRGKEYITPKAEESIMPNDEILVIGKGSKVTKFNKFISS